MNRGEHSILSILSDESDFVNDVAREESESPTGQCCSCKAGAAGLPGAPGVDGRNGSCPLSFEYILKSSLIHFNFFDKLYPFCVFQFPVALFEIAEKFRSSKRQKFIHNNSIGAA